MVSRLAASAVLAVLLHAGADARAQRPAFQGVSAIRIANYGAPSLLLEERGEVAALLQELNRLRARPWRREDATLQCYSTVVLMHGKKRVGELRVRPDHLVERPVEKGQSAYTLAIEPADIPLLTRMLSGIKPAVCR